MCPIGHATTHAKAERNIRKKINRTHRPIGEAGPVPAAKGNAFGLCFQYSIANGLCQNKFVDAPTEKRVQLDTSHVYQNQSGKEKRIKMANYKGIEVNMNNANQKIVVYECDHRACAHKEKCDCDACGFTEDITHAKNFELKLGMFVERVSKC